MVEFNPTHEIREGVDVVWQVPANAKAVLYIAHSGGGNPFTYWPSHPNVPQCTGTPEHKVLIKDALERGFAVIAGKSASGMWANWPAPNVDTQNFEKTLKAWTSEHGLEDLPLSGLGSSSGGDYMSCLATVVKFHSIILMICQGRPEAFKAAVPGEYPATMFVPMTGDERTMSLVKENSEILKAKGIPCAIQEAPPLKVHRHFFAEHIDELEEEKAAKLHSLFVEYGIVAEDNSVNRVLMKSEVEPYLRKADLLPTVDDDQRQQDEEKLNQAKKLKAEGKSKQAGGVQGPGGPPEAGRLGHPSAGGRAGGRGPPSVRGEGPPAGGRAGGRGPPSVRGEAPPARGRGGGRGRGGPMPEEGGRPSGEAAPCHPLANAVSNQLTVAQGNHTLTSRHNKEIFAWLEGKGVPNAQAA